MQHVPPRTCRYCFSSLSALRRWCVPCVPTATPRCCASSSARGKGNAPVAVPLVAATHTLVLRVLFLSSFVLTDMMSLNRGVCGSHASPLG